MALSRRMQRAGGVTKTAPVPQAKTKAPVGTTKVPLERINIKGTSLMGKTHTPKAEPMLSSPALPEKNYLEPESKKALGAPSPAGTDTMSAGSNEKENEQEAKNLQISPALTDDGAVFDSGEHSSCDVKEEEEEEEEDDESLEIASDSSNYDDCSSDESYHEPTPTENSPARKTDHTLEVGYSNDACRASLPQAPQQYQAYGLPRQEYLRQQYLHQQHLYQQQLQAQAFQRASQMHHPNVVQSPASTSADQAASPEAKSPANSPFETEAPGEHSFDVTAPANTPAQAKEKYARMKYCELKAAQEADLWAKKALIYVDEFCQLSPTRAPRAETVRNLEVEFMTQLLSQDNQSFNFQDPQSYMGTMPSFSELNLSFQNQTHSPRASPNTVVHGEQGVLPQMRAAQVGSNQHLRPQAKSEQTARVSAVPQASQRASASNSPRFNLNWAPINQGVNRSPSRFH